MATKIDLSKAPPPYVPPSWCQENAIPIALYCIAMATAVVLFVTALLNGDQKLILGYTLVGLHVVGGGYHCYLRRYRFESLEQMMKMFYPKYQTAPQNRHHFLDHYTDFGVVTKTSDDHWYIRTNKGCIDLHTANGSVKILVWVEGKSKNKATEIDKESKIDKFIGFPLYDVRCPAYDFLGALFAGKDPDYQLYSPPPTTQK